MMSVQFGCPEANRSTQSDQPSWRLVHGTRRSLRAAERTAKGVATVHIVLLFYWIDPLQPMQTKISLFSVPNAAKHIHAR